MPNVINASGIQIQTAAEIRDEILLGTSDYLGMYAIYGPDINVAPNSPDGQMINIVTQAKLDVLEMVQQVFTSFDPDQAVGVLLDQRCAINGVYRQPGSKTVISVRVNVDRALVLQGLDTYPNNTFKVSDTIGNKYQLITTTVFSGPGGGDVLFQALAFGPIDPEPGTVTIIATPTLGVTDVNNSIPTVSTGTFEESDYSLRIRRAQSTGLGSKGYLTGMYGALSNVAGVTASTIVENIGAHTIWVVVDGGTDADVANAIYIKRNAGVGMIGSVSVPITQTDGTVFYVLFDRPVEENLFISMDIDPIYGGFDPVYIRSQLAAKLTYAIGQPANTTNIVALVNQIAPNVSVSSEGVSDHNGDYQYVISPLATNYRFNVAISRIYINGAPG